MTHSKEKGLGFPQKALTLFDRLIQYISLPIIICLIAYSVIHLKEVGEYIPGFNYLVKIYVSFVVLKFSFKTYNFLVEK